MLLAVIGLADASKLTQNEIRFAPPLLERYARIFALVRGPNDHANPHYPFFHLRGDRFWHLRARPGRKAVLAALDTVRSIASLEQNVDCATLDPDLYRLLLDSPSRERLREQLVVAWFGSSSAPLRALFDDERNIDRAEMVLRDAVENKPYLAAETASEEARSAAFRRIVTEAYDYRCAASAWRIILPDSTVLVEAAHIVPYAETKDDDPRNGIALAPSYHWAMDKHVIAPGPDLKWHVSKVLDERVADNRPLLLQQGKEIILPRDRKYAPKRDALEWRLVHLLT